MNLNITKYMAPRKRPGTPNGESSKARKQLFLDLDSKCQGNLNLWLNESKIEYNDRRKIYDLITVEKGQPVLKPKGLNISDTIKESTISKLPKGLVFNRDWTFINCNNLTELEDIKFESGSLSIIECNSLSRLVGTINISGHFNIRKCNQLGNIGDKLNVEGDCSIVKCNQLRSIGNELNVMGDCSIEDCNQLSALAEHANVKKSLAIENCSSIKLSENLTIGEGLGIINCPKITDIPQSILQKRKPIPIKLKGTGIPRHLLLIYWRRSKNNGISSISLEDIDAPDLSANANDLLELSNHALERSGEHPLWEYAKKNKTIGGFNDFSNFLLRLMTDFGEFKLQEQLSTNIKAMLTKMEMEFTNNNHTIPKLSVTDEILTSSELAVGSCSDRIKLGYVLVQALLKDDENKTTYHLINRVISVIKGIDEGTILLDESHNPPQFIGLKSLVQDERFKRHPDLLRKQEYIHYLTSPEPINLSSDIDFSKPLMSKEAALSDILIQIQGINQHIIKVELEDPVEDALSISYQLISQDFHQIKMQFLQFVTLENQLASAVKAYIKSHH